MKKRRKTRTSRHHNKSKNTGKFVAAALIPIAVIGLGGAAMLAYTNVEKPDADFCYARTDQHKAAIFIDNSLTQLSDAQMRDYRTGFERAYQSAPANARILFFTTAKESNNSLAKPVFSMCKPAATVAEQAAIGAPDKPAPYLKHQAEEAGKRYHLAVERVLREVQDPQQAAGDSPILEQLRAISRNDDFSASQRSLTVITDGIQNSETASFCVNKGAMPPFATFKQRVDYALSIAPRSFAGTSVNLLLVENGTLPAPSLPYCSTNELRSWWVDYFKGNGAVNVEMTPLRYWAGVL
jgi:hypothetical protein